MFFQTTSNNHVLELFCVDHSLLSSEISLCSPELITFCQWQNAKNSLGNWPGTHLSDLQQCPFSQPSCNSPQLLVKTARVEGSATDKISLLSVVGTPRPREGRLQRHTFHHILHRASHPIQLQNEPEVKSRVNYFTCTSVCLLVE